MTHANPKFGDKLKQLRKKLGKSQTEMAEEIAEYFTGKIRISQTTLSSLEQRADLPREEILEVLSRYFGVPIAYFYPSLSPDERIEHATQYLERLKNHRFNDSEAFARSDVHRSEGDDIARQLREMRELLDYDEDAEHMEY